MCNILHILKSYLRLTWDDHADTRYRRLEKAPVARHRRVAGYRYIHTSAAMAEIEPLAHIV